MTSTQPVGSSGPGVPDPVALPPRTPGRWAAMILGAPGVGVVAVVVAWMVATSEGATGPPGVEDVMALLGAGAVAMFWNGHWLMNFVLVLVAPWLTSIMVVTDVRVRRPADATSHR